MCHCDHLILDNKLVDINNIYIFCTDMMIIFNRGLLDVETAIQHDLISYPTAYLMAKMTSDTARIAGEHFNLHYFDQHFYL